jgi:hypothetical protein
MTKRGIVYLLGVVLFGLLYFPLRRAVGNDVVFLMAALAYLIALRFIGWLWERTAERKGSLSKPKR